MAEVSPCFYPIPTPKILRMWDEKSATEYHLPVSRLMAAAATGAFLVIKKMFHGRPPAVIFMGEGNNGGDAAVLGRILHDEGHDVLICHAFPLSDILENNGTAASNACCEALRAGVEFLHVNPEDIILPPRFCQSKIIIDGLLGTGFTPPVRAPIAKLIDFLNRHKTSVPDLALIALDIPSGMDAVTGTPSPVAVKADRTITFETWKPGMYSPAGRRLCGEISVVPVGIPLAVKKELPPDEYGIGKGCINFLSPPFPDMHKNSAGHVLVIGGSENLLGAAIFAALGAFRAGAGLVTVTTLRKLLPALHLALPEATTFPLEELPQKIKEEGLQFFQAIILGPGLGTAPFAHSILKSIFLAKRQTELFPPLVLDADGLNVLSRHPEYANWLNENDVLTPHPGEMGRLLGISPHTVQADRRLSLKKILEKYAAVVVLKGANTLVGCRNMPRLLSPFSSPCLAIGGSGDLLAGVIGAFLCRPAETAPWPPSLALASLGVYVHGLAGRELAVAYPERGNLTREIADMIPHVLGNLRLSQKKSASDA